MAFRGFLRWFSFLANPPLLGLDSWEDLILVLRSLSRLLVPILALLTLLSFFPLPEVGVPFKMKQKKVTSKSSYTNKHNKKVSSPLDNSLSFLNPLSLVLIHLVRIVQELLRYILCENQRYPSSHAWVCTHKRENEHISKITRLRLVLQQGSTLAVAWGH